MQDVYLERFVDRMAQIIVKYADAVDWDKLPDMVDEADSKESASFIKKYFFTFLKINHIIYVMFF